jgi:hypothetical protein
MKDAPEPSHNDAKARAARYRARALEVRKETVAMSWTGLKASFLQIARAYDTLASQVEAAEPDASDKPGP